MGTREEQHEAMEKTARNRRVIELHKEGKSMTQVSRTLRQEGFAEITSQRVFAIVKRAKERGEV